jgi:hypothetical protein
MGNARHVLGVSTYLKEVIGRLMMTFDKHKEG